MNERIVIAKVPPKNEYSKIIPNIPFSAGEFVIIKNKSIGQLKEKIETLKVKSTLLAPIINDIVIARVGAEKDNNIVIKS